MFEAGVFLAVVAAGLALVSWFDRRAARVRPIRRWDGTNQAHPFSLGAVAAEQVRQFAGYFYCVHPTQDRIWHSNMRGFYCGACNRTIV